MLTAEDVNLIEDWVSRLEATTRSMQDAADTMRQAAEHNMAAAIRMKNAVDNIPYSIRLDR